MIIRTVHKILNVVVRGSELTPILTLILVIFLRQGFVRKTRYKGILVISAQEAREGLNIPKTTANCSPLTLSATKPNQTKKRKAVFLKAKSLSNDQNKSEKKWFNFRNSSILYKLLVIMAAHFHPPTILCLFILLFISDIPQFFSQSTSPQNIQTYYPFSPPPPTPVNDQPNIPPPTTSIPPPQPQRRSSTRSAVGKAIGVTAASTLVLSGLLFFFLLRYSRRKRENGSTAAAAAHGGTNAVAPQNGDFMRFNGNVKGVIVDEDGLDVLYWRKLQEGENRSSFKKQYYKNLSDEQEEEEKRTVSDRERRYRTPVQEAPLLRGKSSTSQSPIWGDNEEQIFKKTPSVSTQMAVRVEGKQYSSVQLVKNATLPPPPGASPQSLSSLPLVPPQIPLAVGAVPKGKVAAPPPPPPIPSNKGPAPPPPPPPSSGSAASSLKPPPVPKGEPSKRSSSLGEDTSSNGNGQVKLKPLHWDKVNPNVEHSMVWDKIDKGSFK